MVITNWQPAKPPSQQTFIFQKAALPARLFLSRGHRKHHERLASVIVSCPPFAQPAKGGAPCKTAFRDVGVYKEYRYTMGRTCCGQLMFGTPPIQFALGVRNHAPIDTFAPFD
jgi:hypothetical protein